MRLYGSNRLAIPAMVCICSDGTENAADSAYRSDKIPPDEWTAQQLREATPWGKGPKYLIRDRDKKYATHFSAVAGSIKEVKTPYRPRQMEFVKGSWAACAENAWITLFFASENEPILILKMHPL
jgi:hypothetical protein